LADILTSMVKVFSDLERSVCRMVHRQVIDSFFCDIQCRLEISYAGGTSSIYFLWSLEYMDSSVATKIYPPRLKNSGIWFI
jgi:hypothetical protein